MGECLDDSDLGKKLNGVAFYEASNLNPWKRIIGIYRYGTEDVEMGRMIYKSDGMGTLYWPQKPDGSWGYDETNFPIVALAVIIDPNDEETEENELSPVLDDNKTRRLRKRAERDSADFFGKAEPILQPVQGSRKWRMTSTFSGKVIEEEELEDMNSNQEGLRAERSSGLHGYELEPTYYLLNDPDSLVGMDKMVDEFKEKLTEFQKNRVNQH